MSRLTAKKTICFLDVDGVLCKRYNKLEPYAVENLNTLLDEFPETSVVMNTAWNRHPVSTIRRVFAEHGFRHPERIISKTNNTSGSWPPMREWINRHESRDPFIIIDDSNRYPVWARGRLVNTISSVGFDHEMLTLAQSILTRTVTPAGEVAAIAQHLLWCMDRIINHSPWLSAEYVGKYVAEINENLKRLEALDPEEVIKLCNLCP